MDKLTLTPEDRQNLGVAVLKAFTNFNNTYDIKTDTPKVNEDRIRRLKIVHNTLADSEKGFEKVVAALCNVLLYEVENGWAWDKITDDEELPDMNTPEAIVKRYKSLKLFRGALTAISDSCKINEERILDNILKEE